MTHDHLDVVCDEPTSGRTPSSVEPRVPCLDSTCGEQTHSLGHRHTASGQTCPVAGCGRAMEPHPFQPTLICFIHQPKGHNVGPDDAATAPIDREFASFQRLVGAPKKVRLGCVSVSHDRLGFCAACTEPSLAHLELECWRLLALREVR